MARQVAPLTMLGDASGQTPNVGTSVIAPWAYEYAYPSNCMKARFIPRNYLNPNAVPQGNIALPDVPLTTVSQPPTGYGMRLIPSPFLISMDTNYPIDASSNWLEQQGASPGGRIVILSNVNVASLVFTAFMPYPNMWDAQFRAAMVAYLAAQIAMPLAKDKKFGLELRDRNIKIAKERIDAARVTNGNESAFPQTIDHTPDWMRARIPGGAGSGLNGGPGCGVWSDGGFGWDGCGFLGYGFDSSIF